MRRTLVFVSDLVLIHDIARRSACPWSVSLAFVVVLRELYRSETALPRYHLRTVILVESSEWNFGRRKAG